MAVCAVCNGCLPSQVDVGYAALEGVLAQSHPSVGARAVGLGGFPLTLVLVVNK